MSLPPSDSAVFATCKRERLVPADGSELICPWKLLPAMSTGDFAAHVNIQRTSSIRSGRDCSNVIALRRLH